MADGITWVDFRPVADDNRKKDAGDQVYCQIKRLSSLELLAQQSWLDVPAQLFRWRDETLKAYLADPDSDEAAAILELSPMTLGSMRQFVECSKDHRNFRDADGQEFSDPVDIYLNLAGDASGGMELIAEVQSGIKGLSRVKGDDLKNFAARCSGLKVLESTAPTAGEAAGS
jgi:hypothetical protein